MISLFDDKLRDIDHKMATILPREIPNLFDEIPLDIFGQLLLDVPAEYQNMKAYFPSMSSEASQRHWTGDCGVSLLNQSVMFIKSLVHGYARITGKSLENEIILDYGCGWGRLIRLLYKYVYYENIFAVDPWDQSIDECRKHGIKANLAISEWVPKILPFKKRFDLIFSFSVFTHLSEKTTRIILDTLRNYISDDGVLVITIRPKEYWQVHNDREIISEMIKLHDEKGFAFSPLDLPPIDGDITYGDTSISLKYLYDNFPQWELAFIEYSNIDPYQVILFLKPKLI